MDYCIKVLEKHRHEARIEMDRCDDNENSEDSKIILDRILELSKGIRILIKNHDK